MCLPKLHVVAVTHGLGEWMDVARLSGFDQRSDDGVVLGAASEPAKSAFFRLRVIGGMERSTGRFRTRYGRHQGSALVPANAVSATSRSGLRPKRSSVRSISPVLRFNPLAEQRVAYGSIF